MTSPYITKSLALSAMSLALQPYANIDLNGFRLAAYVAAGIPVEDILDYDGEAYFAECKRRAVMLAPGVHVPNEMTVPNTVAIGLTGLAFCLLSPDAAFAHTLIEPRMEWPIFWIAAAIMFGIPVLLIAVAAYLYFTDYPPRDLPRWGE